jgi:2-oxoglutarate-Fe(II)-dependent dioxygenase family protein
METAYSESKCAVHGGVPLNPAFLTEQQKQLLAASYAILPADALISAGERREIAKLVFDCPDLEQDPVNHQRSRLDDTLLYDWRGDGSVDLREAPGNHPDPNRIYIQYTRIHRDLRHYRRLVALAVPPVHLLVQRVLQLVPTSARRCQGQFDLHAFRTVGRVTDRHHRDGNDENPVDWVVSYIVSKRGAGACSELTLDAESAQVVTRVTLGEGQLIIHYDKAFYHYVSPLEKTSDAPRPIRDALIMTIRPRLVPTTLRGGDAL